MDSGRAGRRDEENVFMEEEEDDVADYSAFGQEVEPDGDGRKRVLSFSGKKGSSASASSSSSGGSTPTLAAYICQVDYCSANMANAKTYHRRHKVCEFHSKAQVAIVAGQHQRFCQQCSRFHAVSQFDDTKRSCRRRLAGHNQRRRRSSYETQGEGSDEIRT